MTRAEILAEAARWLDTPWRHQASVRGAGADCIGFVAGVAAACGSPEAKRFLETPDWRRYGRHPQPDFLFAVCDQLMDRIETGAATSADVLLFNCGKHPMHFGFVGEGGRMVHAYFQARRVCEHQLDADWQARIQRAYRIRGVA